jgi:hypothetical protein
VENRTGTNVLPKLDFTQESSHGRIDHGDRCIDREQVRDGFAWRDVRDDKPGAPSDAEKEGR